jgi:hypothetical protein
MRYSTTFFLSYCLLSSLATAFQTSNLGTVFPDVTDVFASTPDVFGSTPDVFANTPDVFANIKDPFTQVTDVFSRDVHPRLRPRGGTGSKVNTAHNLHTHSRSAPTSPSKSAFHLTCQGYGSRQCLLNCSCTVGGRFVCEGEPELAERYAELTKLCSGACRCDRQERRLVRIK